MKGLILIASIVLLTGCASTMGGPRATATANLGDPAGRPAGTARLEQVSGGVHVVLEMTAMRPGAHGVHIHAIGKCDPPGFTTAGGHFNPGNRQHGTLNPQGPHAGDLPNITIEADGAGRMETLTDRVRLEGDGTSLFDADGSALVVHAGPDDFTTDPSGGSGARIACGALVKQEPPTGKPPRGSTY